MGRALIKPELWVESATWHSRSQERASAIPSGCPKGWSSSTATNGSLDPAAGADRLRTRRRNCRRAVEGQNLTIEFRSAITGDCRHWPPHTAWTKMACTAMDPLPRWTARCCARAGGVCMLGEARCNGSAVAARRFRGSA